MIELAERPITPWVGRLLAANAVVLLAQQTVFTSPAVAHLLEFDAALVLQYPWIFVTYMFVHAGILHLLANSLTLFMFGPTVERRFGSRLFIAYYLLCGVGAAVVAMILQLFHLGSPQFLGASGAIVGVLYAFARLAPDAQLMIFPLPVPVRARYVVAFLALYDLVGLFAINDNIAHAVHLGGLFTGIAFFTVRSLGRPTDNLPLPSVRRRVTVATGGAAGTQRTMTSMPSSAVTAAAPPAPEPTTNAAAADAAELDRVLDKISAQGIDALSTAERHFLDAMARRRRDLN